MCDCEVTTIQKTQSMHKNVSIPLVQGHPKHP